MNKLKVIAEATRIAKMSRCRYNLGAVLVSRGQIVAKSSNLLMRVSGPNNFRWSNLHAEEAVLVKATSTKGRNRIR